MRTITKDFGEFPMAHRQWKHDGHCALIHGHNWRVSITFKSEDGDLDSNGFIIDFGKMGPLKVKIAEFMDHTLLLCQDDPLVLELAALERKMGKPLFKLNTLSSSSCEAIAEFIYWLASSWLASSWLSEIKKFNVSVIKVTVWEDEKNSATFSE